MIQYRHLCADEICRELFKPFIRLYISANSYMVINLICTEEIF